MSAAEILKVLGGLNGMARCLVPGHRDRKPSLSISDGPDGKILAKCHGGCPQTDVWAALKDRGLVGNGRTSRRHENSKVSPGTPSRPNRRAEALAFWEASRPAFGTPVEEHLRCRGIIIEPPACIRYHAGKNALVALVQAPDGTFSGIQRIYLTTDCRGTWKQGRFSLGLVKGGAVRLTPTAESLQLCESVEDGLALLQMTGKPTWAVPGAGFMESFEPPPTVREVPLGPDNDKAGHEAIEKAALLLTSRRVRVGCLLPPANADWCDVLEDFDERSAIAEFDGGLDRDEAEIAAWEGLRDDH